MTMEEMKKKIEEMKHLEKAMEATNLELSKLKQDFEKKVQERVSEITNKMTAENKDLKESLANSQNAFQLRIKQLEGLLFSHGDLLKSLQALTDTHLKLNQYIVEEINGGK